MAFDFANFMRFLARGVCLRGSVRMGYPFTGMALTRLDGTAGSTGRDFGFTVIEGPEALRQRCIFWLRMHLGECFVAADRGVPYLGRILRNRITPHLAGQIIANGLRTQVQGVERVEDIQTDFNTSRRFLTLTATVYGTEGEDFQLSTGITLLGSA